MKRYPALLIINQGAINYNHNETRMAKILKTDTSKGWLGCGATATFMHYWWEYETNSDTGSFLNF